MIRNVEQAFKEIKNFSVEGWDGDYRPAGRQFLKEVLEEQMALAVDRHLAEVVVQGIADGRNGSYPRHLLTELGDLELSVRRTRTFNPASLLKQWAGRFARRARSVERMILSSFTLGLSTRKVGPALLPVLGELVSAEQPSLRVMIAPAHSRNGVRTSYRWKASAVCRRTGAHDPLAVRDGGVLHQ